MHRSLRLVAILAGLASVLVILPRAGAQSSVVPNDPLFPQQWYLHNTGQDGGKSGADIHALEAWSITRCSPNVTIGVIDTGVDAHHPDLADRLVPGTAFGTGDVSTVDDQGHGTATAGVVAATGDNGIGVTGVCPLGRIMPIRIAQIADGAYDHINSFRVARAIHWAVNHGVRVISMSIGVEDSPDMRAATAYAYNHGVVLVAATGNTGQQFTYAPVDDPHVIAVGGTDNQDRRASFSSYGPNHDMVLAPARNILSTARGGSYIALSGTSLATPQVAGLAALLLSIRPDLTVDQITAAIEQGTDPVQGQSAYDEKDGYGRINCYRSLKIAQAMPGASPVETPGPTDTPTPVFAPSVVLANSVRRSQKQTIRVTTVPLAHIDAVIIYHNSKVVYHHGQTNASGQYRDAWRVPRIPGGVTVNISVSTDTGDLAVIHRHFRIV